jgi:hypothetical protein
MDIQTIGAWGEILGGVSGTVAAFGVILTLLYLARQIHQNTDHVRAQVAHGLMTALREQGDAVKQSKETADMYYRAWVGLENLTDGERWQFESIRRLPPERDRLKLEFSGILKMKGDSNEAISIHRNADHLDPEGSRRRDAD